MKFRSVLMAGIILLAACSKKNDNPNEDGSGKPPEGAPQVIALPVVTGDALVSLGPQDGYANVMENLPGTLPTFPALAKKAGKIRGFVTDLSGKPVEHAFIGIRSSAIGGHYSSASGTSNKAGYYEVELPVGAVHFWAAGVAVEYAGGIAAMGLYAADGATGSFASATGEVENFVLLSYGRADVADIQMRPWYSPNYFGGSILLDYQIADPDDIFSPETALPEGSEIEITLTPDGGFLYGENKRFIIRKKIGNLNCHINNIPVGKYRISAKLMDGTVLTMRTNGPGQQGAFGLKPAVANGSGTLTFIPGNAKAEFAAPNRGDWAQVNITVEMP